GSPIPPGSGILFYLNYAEVGDESFDENISISDLTCLDITEGFILGPQGNTFDVNMGECISSPIDCSGGYYGSAYIDNCGVCDTYENNDCSTYTLELLQGANLISFHSLPTDVSVSSIFSDLGDNAIYIITEGFGAYYMSGIWYGSLQTISAHKGYWLIIEDAGVITIDDAVPTSLNENNLVYDLHSGNNLMSYPFSVGQDLYNAIDDIYLTSFFAMAGSGVAAQYTNGNW
ncbi:uncharacterized protein METZ01_LOCUS511211, partial [marine metagenome]